MSAPSRIRYHKFAALLLLSLAGYLGLAFAQGTYFKLQAKETLAVAEAKFREIFPNEKRIVNLRVQLKSQLSQGQNKAGKGFIDLLYPIGSQIADLHKKDSDAVTIKRISFREQSGYVQLEMLFKSYAYVDELKRSIEAQGLKASIDGANKGSEDKINARLRVSI